MTEGQSVTQHHEMSRFAHLGKVKKRESITMYFVKIDQLRYPAIDAEWLTFFLEAIDFLCSEGNFLQRTFITMGGCHHLLTITT
jgi:hypothetical protein